MTMIPVAIEADKHSSMEIGFRGTRLFIDREGILYWPEEKLLVVSDLHLEKGSSLAMRARQFLPPYDTHTTLARLTSLLDYWQPKTVISLGDSFHDDEASSRLTPECCATIAELMRGREWIWICGNHDPNPPAELGGLFSTQLQLGALNFCHEPLTKFVHGEIAGHLHPAAKIKRRGKSVRRRCVAGDEHRLILPAFGAYTGGLNIRDEAFSGLFDIASQKVWMLGRDTIFEIGSRHLVR